METSAASTSAARVMPTSSFCASSTICFPAEGSRPTCTTDPVMTGAGTSMYGTPSMTVSWIFSASLSAAGSCGGALPSKVWAMMPPLGPTTST